eukprot:tig00000215_g18601.t1
MATKRGVYQLSKLSVHYCKHGGSSAGMREYIAKHLVPFAEANPWLRIETQMKPNKHPHIIGTYVTGISMEDGCRNLSPEEIHEKVLAMRNKSSSKPPTLVNRVITKHPSIQGVWHPGLAPQDIQSAEHQNVSSGS